MEEGGLRSFYTELIEVLMLDTSFRNTEPHPICTRNNFQGERIEIPYTDKFKRNKI